MEIAFGVTAVAHLNGSDAFALIAVSAERAD
jgi:hypothetical protein